jgi:uncharacterized protein YqgV (UPF0045/DUF77 family)
VIVEVECLPTPPGNESAPYAHVEAAIAVIQDSGLAYEVSALGTTLEGHPDHVWTIVRDVHEACLTAGARSVVTIIKACQSASPDGPTMASLTSKFRV